MTLTDPYPVFKVATFLKSNIVKTKTKLLLHNTIPNIWNGTMFGDLD